MIRYANVKVVRELHELTRILYPLRGLLVGFAKHIGEAEIIRDNSLNSRTTNKNGENHFKKTIAPVKYFM